MFIRRLLLIVIPLVVLVLVAGFVAWRYFTNSPILDQNGVPTDQAGDAVNNNSIINNSVVNSTASKSTPESTSAKTFAMNFAEKFGTMSTDNLNNQADRLKPFVTTSLAGRLTDLLSKNKPSATTFYAVTTRAVTAEILSQQPEAALVVVTTQREESLVRGGETKVSYQKLRVVLVKGNNVWLVDAVSWDK